MELGWGTLFLICIAAAVAWFWRDSLAARERANDVAVDACERMGLQFLDGTVAFARIAFVRVQGGAIGLRRTYVFDYTADSIDRRQGFVILIGHRVESVGYASTHESPRQPQSQPETPPRSPIRTSADTSNVLDLADWRARQRKPPTHRALPQADSKDRNR